MTPFERFKKGDIVTDYRHGDGKVIWNDGKHIVVACPVDINAPNAREPVTLTLDRDWFDRHPQGLKARAAC